MIARHDPRAPAPRWVRDEAVLWRRVDDDIVVLLPPGAPEPLALRGSGAALWAGFEHPRTLDELTSELAERHDVAAERVRVDVEPAVRDLLACGALRPAR